VDLSRFALFVSLDPKNPVPVTRFGPGTMIAAERDPSDKNGRTIRYRPDEVVAITREEMAQYGREYGRALRAGSLIQRTEADYRAFLKAQEDAERKRGAEVRRRKDEAEAERKADAAATKQAETAAPTAPVSGEAPAVNEELTDGS